MVAQGSRWLCAGHNFADCEELQVPRLTIKLQIKACRLQDVALVAEIVFGSTTRLGVRLLLPSDKPFVKSRKLRLAISNDVKGK